ncbi:hypothetical protein B9Z55_015581 [Caenorhabditis nigoni]|uniref:F-box associated domain-containing protein n=1 Tax=Caenorhabditis nigoni TaxID=1611254 RepID=A0A2G5UAU5_9PELO|nr:hypothetical protein B9Z55_015581 [Caenorhabditis nigoni]
MNEPPKNPKFGLLMCPFALREQIVRNMELMDAVEAIEERNSFRIGLSESNAPSERDPAIMDGVKLASFINETADDYRKKLSAHILFIFHSKLINVHIERNLAEPLRKFFLWDVSKTFDFVRIGWCGSILISSEDLKFILQTIKSIRCCLGIKIDDAHFKYQEAMECENFLAKYSAQWLDTVGILHRNPKMKKLHLQNIQGEQINDLLKQWINGEVDLEFLIGSNRNGLPADVILDGIVTLDPTIAHEQAKEVYPRRVINGQLMNIQRKIDGQLATIHLTEKECFAIMWTEKRLAELRN